MSISLLSAAGFGWRRRQAAARGGRTVGARLSHGSLCRVRFHRRLARGAHRKRPLARACKRGRIAPTLDLGPARRMAEQQLLEQMRMRLARVEAWHVIELVAAAEDKCRTIAHVDLLKCLQAVD